MRLGFEIMVEELNLVQVQVSDLARTLRGVSRTKGETLEKMSRAAAASALGGWTWRHAAERMEDCFQDLVKARHPSF